MLEEILMIFDSRWNDPNKLPVSNGLITFRTPPDRFSFYLSEDGTRTTYQLSYPIHIIDDAHWEPIEISVNGYVLTIDKPIVVPYETSTQVNTESPEYFWTIIGVNCAQIGQFSPADGWKVVHSLLGWIRVKCRHYWLLHGSTGFGARYRTTVYERQGPRISQHNSVGYGGTVIVLPLTMDIWRSCKNELSSEMTMPLPDSLYCDALLSLSAGDAAKAVVEAGVAAEVAITQLLADAAHQLPATEAKTSYLERERSRRFPGFAEKIKQWPQKMGLEAASTYCPSGFPQSWLQDAELLYQERNGIAHSGIVSDAANSPTLSQMIFAANATLQYCREQRLEHGLSVFSMPVGQTPFQQTVCFTDGAFTAVTNKTEGILNI